MERHVSQPAGDEHVRRLAGEQLMQHERDDN